jgi:hypothetical protein
MDLLAAERVASLDRSFEVASHLDRVSMGHFSRQQAESIRFSTDDEIVRLLKRLLQRLLIFGLNIFSIWLIVFVVLETADRRLPWILAMGITYGFAANIVLPRAIRWGLKILSLRA